MSIKIDKKSPVPLYYQIADQIEGKIHSREYSEGLRLPGNLELSGILGVSDLTVNSAYSLLVEKGLIERRKRAGTFVKGTAKMMPRIGFFYFNEDKRKAVIDSAYIHDYLADEGYGMQIIGFDAGYFDGVDLAREVSRYGLHGAVIVPLDNESCRKNLLNLEKEGFPYVRYSNEWKKEAVESPIVRGNEKQNILGALGYLRKMGHGKIGLISNKAEGESSREYFSSFASERAFKRRWRMSINFSGPFEEWKNFAGPYIARGYLEMNPELSAVMVEHPAACADIVKQAAKRGTSIPGELSVLCLRDWEGFASLSPAVTAMSLPVEKMACTAVRLLMEVIKKGYPVRDRNHYIDYSLVERDSAARYSEAACSCSPVS